MQLAASASLIQQGLASGIQCLASGWLASGIQCLASGRLASGCGDPGTGFGDAGFWDPGAGFGEAAADADPGAAFFGDSMVAPDLSGVAAPRFFFVFFPAAGLLGS